MDQLIPSFQVCFGFFFFWQLEEENHELQLNKSWHEWLFQAPTMVELVPPFASLWCGRPALASSCQS